MKRWHRSTIAVALGLPMIGVLGFGLTRDPGEIASPLPGREAPEFALPVLTSGEATPLHPKQPPVMDTVRLRDLRGKVVVVNYWASWCLACRDEHPVLQQASAAYADSGVQFVGVVYNDRGNNALKWLREMGPVPYPSVMDPRTATAIDYGVYGVPETFFIGRDGRVAYKHFGPLTPTVMQRQLGALLAEPHPPAAPPQKGNRS